MYIDSGKSCVNFVTIGVAVPEKTRIDAAIIRRQRERGWEEGERERERC